MNLQTPSNRDRGQISRRRLLSPLRNRKDPQYPTLHHAPSGWPIRSARRYVSTQIASGDQEMLIWTLQKGGRRAFSSSASRKSYDDTIKNLLIHKDTRVLCQGLTGKTVRLPTRPCRRTSVLMQVSSSREPSTSGKHWPTVPTWLEECRPRRLARRILGCLSLAQ